MMIFLHLAKSPFLVGDDDVGGKWWVVVAIPVEDGNAIATGVGEWFPVTINGVLLIFAQFSWYFLKIFMQN